MRYDYICNNCEHMQEEIHGMLERPVIGCEICGVECSKMISGDPQFIGVDGTANLYNFTDFNTTGKPVVINSRTQWKNHLKKHGLNDDVQNSPYTKSQLESKMQTKTIEKERNKKEIKKTVVEAYKQRKSPQARQRVKEVLKKGGK